VACLPSNGKSAHAEASRLARLGPDDSMDKTQKFISTAPCGILLMSSAGPLVLLDASDQIRMPKRELLSAVKSLLCRRSCRPVSRENGVIGNAAIKELLPSAGKLKFDVGVVRLSCRSTC
jgi:hypothetical protein